MLEVFLPGPPHTSLSWLSQALFSKQWHNQRSAGYASDRIGAGRQYGLTRVRIDLWCSMLVNCPYPEIGGISVSMLLAFEHPHHLAPVSNFFFCSNCNSPLVLLDLCSWILSGYQCEHLLRDITQHISLAKNTTVAHNSW